MVLHCGLFPAHSRNHPIIPTQVNRIWLGGAPIPERYERYWRAWQRQLPNAQFRTWRDADVAQLPVAGPLLSKASMPVQRADIARYDIILQHGGVYLDCDIMPLAYPEFFAGDELITCNENDGDEIRSIGFFAAPPGHPTLRRALELIGQADLGRAAPNFETGPHLFRRAVVTERRLPSATFYPYGDSEPFSRIFDRDLLHTWGIHVWGRTWLPDKALVTYASRCLASGDVREAEELLDQCASQEGSERASALRQMCLEVRGLRRALLDGLRSGPMRELMARSPLIGLPGRVSTKPHSIKAVAGVPRFFEAAWHLLTRHPDTVVWQVGACDGILADGLRPLLVNFDPVALLVEPHPQMHARLADNYRRNERSVLANVAVGRVARPSELIAMDPDAATKDDLPDWAIGLSSLHGDRNALGGKTVTPEMRARLLAATRRIPVEVVTPDELRRRAGIGWPDLLFVDTEGSDAEVVHALLDVPVLPKLVYFETICLPAEELAELLARLSATHLCIDLPQNMMAIRHDMLEELVCSAFLEQGRRTLLDLFGMDLVVPPPSQG